MAQVLLDVTDSGKFIWKGKHKLFTEPDGNYHGLRWAMVFLNPLLNRFCITRANRSIAQFGGYYFTG